MPQACRRPGNAKQPWEVAALRHHHMQVEEFDFYTVPNCWNHKSYVVNKYPKYVLAPLDFFFFF